MRNFLSQLILDPILAKILFSFVILGLSPLFAGILSKFRANIEGRQGPPILQPYYDLKKLCKKEMILPEASSWIFSLFPYLVLIIMMTLTLVIPVFSIHEGLAYAHDLIFIFALFVLIAFFMVLTSFDTGNSFIGMGASREAFLVSLIEPVILLMIFALAMEFNTSDLFIMVREATTGSILFSHPSSFFIAIAFIVVLLTEAKRFPVDNPNTHLELTMIHEALLLEYSGPYLAMLEYASMLKFTILASIFFSLFFSYGITDGLELGQLTIAALAWFIKMVVLIVLIAFYEKSTAKLRLFKVPELLSFAIVLTLITIFAHIYIEVW